MFAEVILPVPLPTIFTYRIPEGEQVEVGMRVQVPLGSRSLYKGIVMRIFEDEPEVGGIRDIQAVLDPYPLVDNLQIRFWEWLADYYMCTLGEVYRTAMPRGLKETYSPRYQAYAKISENYRDENSLNKVMDELIRAPKQLLILQRLLELLMDGGDLGTGLPKSELSGGIDFSPSAYKGLIRKEIITEYHERALRIPDEGRIPGEPRSLTTSQESALDEITNQFRNKPVVLLKGVTSSGKTEIYIHLIREIIEQNRQVLYLLPEIALTAQIIERLKNVFGDLVGIYHSKYSDAERVETFLRARENPIGGEYKVILGARSAVFLPFRNLGLVIIDEEHELSYKQADPAPRYHARDAAIVLAKMHSARVLLGSATPSLESYYNARKGKFGLVELNERFGEMSPPEIILSDLKEAYRKKRMISHFTPELFDLMKVTLREDRQVILFQNRRGFSPYIECFSCGWIPGCPDCDVSLVYHKQEGKLVCHYCGYAERIPHQCPECNDTQLVTRGFGTEKLEEEVGILFPDVRIARMDFDTTRSRRKYEKIIRDYESGNTRILVGTQIVTKGLDFDNVGLVGVLHADNILNFPDFRSYERSYQLLSQVAGRSGRKETRGKVIIQTSVPEHPVMQHIINSDYHGMYMNQMEERQSFHYPPYYRLLKITFRHQDRQIVESAANEFNAELRKAFRKLKHIAESGPEILGPQAPLVSRVQQMNIMTLLVKYPRTSVIGDLKKVTGELAIQFKANKLYRKLFIILDVDTY
jgi:primosomal protein N' (replication factor Y)